jgi:hypothetical protein
MRPFSLMIVPVLLGSPALFRETDPVVNAQR